MVPTKRCRRLAPSCATPAAYAAHRPFERFRYSNFAAGLVGCLLEKRFGESLEKLAQDYVFGPLGVQATFRYRDARRRYAREQLSCAACRGRARVRCGGPVFGPRLRWICQTRREHYLLGSGSLFVTAEGLMRLCLPLVGEGVVNGSPFLDDRSRRMMTVTTADWPEPEVRMRHGAGLLEVDDRAIYPVKLNGHQGFAYGAVNGVFLR